MKKHDGMSIVGLSLTMGVSIACGYLWISQAHASQAHDWRVIERSDQSLTYIDAETAKKDKQTLHFTLMEDLIVGDGTMWKNIPWSSTTDYVAKCEGGLITKTRTTEFEGNLADGKVVSSTKFSPHWLNVETQDDEALKYIMINVCNGEDFPVSEETKR